MLNLTRTLTLFPEALRLSLRRAAHTLSAEAPVTRSPSPRILRPGHTALKMAGGVIGVLVLGVSPTVGNHTGNLTES